jgi:hypothetical protein
MFTSLGVQVVLVTVLRVKGSRGLCSFKCSIVVFKKYSIENDVWCYGVPIIYLIIFLGFPVYIKFFHSV